MGKYTAQVKGGLHANYGATIGGVGAWNLIDNHRGAAQEFAHKGDFEVRTLLNTLIGAAAGANAAATYSEIEANVEMGGRRNIVSTPIINRATTAQDISDLKNEIGALSANTYVANPVFNGDRNPLGTR